MASELKNEEFMQNLGKYSIYLLLTQQQSKLEQRKENAFFLFQNLLKILF